jgi:hypothetical protein
VVNRVRRAFDAQQAGHGAPLATAVLPSAFGAATKTVPYVKDGTKLVQRFHGTTPMGPARTRRGDSRFDLTDMLAPRDGRSDPFGRRFHRGCVNSSVIVCWQQREASISTQMTEDARGTRRWFRAAHKPRTKRLISRRGLPRWIIQPRAICVFCVHLLSSALKFFCLACGAAVLVGMAGPYTDPGLSVPRPKHTWPARITVQEHFYSVPTGRPSASAKPATPTTLTVGRRHLFQRMGEIDF